MQTFLRLKSGGSDTEHVSLLRRDDSVKKRPWDGIGLAFGLLSNGTHLRRRISKVRIPPRNATNFAY
jgi:hypothetical protein